MSHFNRVFLCLSEAVNNSIVHGNSLNVEKKVFIRVTCYQNFLFMEVKDEGNGFPFDRVVDPTVCENLKKEHGRGIFLMNHMADEIQFLDGGSRVFIKYTLNNGC
jgi:serine/threonine-protein kinase RsbW